MIEYKKITQNLISKSTNIDKWKLNNESLEYLQNIVVICRKWTQLPDKSGIDEFIIVFEELSQIVDSRIPCLWATIQESLNFLQYIKHSGSEYSDHCCDECFCKLREFMFYIPTIDEMELLKTKGEI